LLTIEIFRLCTFNLFLPSFASFNINTVLVSNHNVFSLKNLKTEREGCQDYKLTGVHHFLKAAVTRNMEPEKGKGKGQAIPVTGRESPYGL
jgi:hypothetical protein